VTPRIACASCCSSGGEALVTLKAAARVDGTFRPTLAGLLALGRFPQQFLPALGVTFVAYPTPGSVSRVLAASVFSTTVASTAQSRA